MKRNLKRILCFVATLFIVVSVPFRVFAIGENVSPQPVSHTEEDKTDYPLFNELQKYDWNEESITAILSSSIGGNVTIARTEYVGGNGGRSVGSYKFSNKGRYYHKGKIGQTEVYTGCWSYSDLSTLAIGAESNGTIGGVKMQNYIAFKFSGNEGDTNMYWVVCKYTPDRTQLKPDGTLAKNTQEALECCAEYAKTEGYKKALEVYMGADAANAFEAAYTNYFENTDAEENNAEQSDNQKAEVKEAEKKAKSDKVSYAISSLSQKTITPAILQDEDLSKWIKDSELAHIKDGTGSTYVFSNDGPWQNCTTRLIFGEGDSLCNDYYCIGEQKIAIRLNIEVVEEEDYWYILPYSTDPEKGTPKDELLAIFQGIETKVIDSNKARDTVVENVDEGGKVADAGGQSHVEEGGVTYEEAIKAEQYEKVSKIEFHVNPLEEMEELDFSSDGNVGLEKLKLTAASFYSFITVIASVGMLISLFMMSVKMMIGGKKEAKASVINMIYKFVVFACICGFVNLWAIFYPIVQSLMM